MPRFNVDRFQAVDGSVAAPSYTFLSELGTGFYRQGAGIFGCNILGVEQWRQSNGQLTFQNNQTITAGANLMISLAQFRNITITPVAVTGPPTVAVNPAAGLLNGAYRYTVTYVTAQGETDPSGFSATANPANQQVDLTNIPTSADARVTARRIYRTRAGTNITDMGLVTTINDNVTTIYTDNVADGALGATYQSRNTTGGLEIFNSAGILYASMSGFTSWGRHSVASVVTGLYNSAFGENALNNLTTGYDNCAFGTAVLKDLTTGHDNTCMGDGAGQMATTLQNFVGIGDHTGYGSPLTANGCTLVGSQAGYSLTSGQNNVCIGWSSGRGLTTGQQNTLVGTNAGYALTVEDDNVIIGYLAAPNLTDTGNVAVGKATMSAATTASYNTIIGFTSGTGITTGDYNVFLGETCGNDITTGSRNVLIGSQNGTAVGLAAGSNKIFMLEVSGYNTSQCYLYGEMEETAAERFLRLGAGRSTAGDTLKDVALYLRAHHWNAADQTWDYKIFHDMQTAGAAPLSQVIHSINAVTIFSMENNNGTARAIFATNVDFSTSGLAIEAPNSDSSTLLFRGRGNGVVLVDIMTIQSGANAAADPAVIIGNTIGYLKLLGVEDLGSGADRVALASYDIAAGRRTLMLTTEEAVAVDVGLASTNSLSVRINGATYKIMLA